MLKGQTFYFHDLILRFSGSSRLQVVDTNTVTQPFTEYFPLLYQRHLYKETGVNYLTDGVTPPQDKHPRTQVG